MLHNMQILMKIEVKILNGHEHIDRVSTLIYFIFIEIKTCKRTTVHDFMLVKGWMLESILFHRGT